MEGPGDKFKSRDAAAKDFGKTCNDNSIRENREYGATIYKDTNKEGVVLYYSYSVPTEGGTAGVKSSPASEGTTPVADAHSHGACLKNYDNNNFSDGPGQDKDKLDREGKPGYLTTPDGSLKKYDPETKKVTVLATDLPSDVKDPERKNSVDATIEKHPNAPSQPMKFIIPPVPDMPPPAEDPIKN